MTPQEEMSRLARTMLDRMYIANSEAWLAHRAAHPSPKPTRWQRFTYLLYRKWWYAYTRWLHRDCE